MNKKIDLTSYKDLIEKSFCYDGLGDTDISKLLEDKGTIVSPSVIGVFRRANNIDKLYKDRDFLLLQLEKGMTALDIAKKINCSDSCITRRLQSFDLKERGESRIKLNPKQDYFSTYTNDSCYWAGFINADGHIEAYLRRGAKIPNYKLSFCIGIKDRKHLKLFRDTICPDGKVKEYTSKIQGRDTIYKGVSFKLSNKSICLDLINKFDIGANHKSLKEIISDKIPDTHKHHFIRGVFDGDGCITLTFSKYNSICGTMTIVGSKQLCLSIKHTLSKEFNRDLGTIRVDCRNEDIWYFYINKKDDIKSFYDFIYKDSNNLYLDRKKEKFEILFGNVKI